MKAVGGCLQDEWTPTQAWGDIQVTELDHLLATVFVPLLGNSGVYIITVLFSASGVVLPPKNNHKSH